MSRARTLVLAVSSTMACFQPSAPTQLFACNADGTCPSRYTCDQAFDGPAVCCIPGALACPTLRNPDTSCANGGTGQSYLRDRDGDGFGNGSEPVIRCARPVGYAATGAREDCDDTNGLVNPDTAEECNGVDDNCNGDIDEGLTRELFVRDEDGDGYPKLDGGVLACAAPPGTVRALGALDDCKPFSPSQHPDAGERCNGDTDAADDDCDGSPFASRYLDTQLVSEPVRFPCVVPNARGVCVDGVLTCSASAQPVCTSLRAPSLEVCDGIDTDCDGVLDNQPGCGGPPSLVNQPNLRYGGGIVPGGLQVSDRCQRGRIIAPGTNVGGRLTGTRSGSDYLVWWAETTSDAGWDLSAENLKMVLAFNATGASPGMTTGLWGTSPNDGVFPVVFLCGDLDTDVVRYRWDSSATAFKLNEMSHRSLLHLDPAQPDGGFILGVGSGFDTRRVRRIEVMLRFFGTTYDVNMLPATGFVK
ncbi:MAG: putative metal-binding motif-containing protein [Myxococcales bacterium]|nr:putative metal-binding motif-containing protein [Myxococcales bacterium]MDP3500700.1 putative metal-binding motif-containing protein [Myxococcales bacterium]